MNQERDSDSGAIKDHSEADLVTELTDEPAAPPVWRDMTPEEKGAVLLAIHEKRRIDSWNPHSRKWIARQWYEVDIVPGIAYRERPEPKRETVVLWAGHNGLPPVRIGTIDFEDGEPDPMSIKLEADDRRALMSLPGGDAA